MCRPEGHSGGPIGLSLRRTNCRANQALTGAVRRMPGSPAVDKVPLALAAAFSPAALLVLILLLAGAAGAWLLSSAIPALD